MKVLSFLFFMSFSFSTLAITVDKMVIIPNSDDVRSEIKVNNPAEHPVLLRISLSEQLTGNQVVKFDEANFQEWPVYIERDELLIGSGEEISVQVQHLARQINVAQERDRIIAIDITPESVVSDEALGQKMSILIGYRVWLILSKDGEIKGKPTVTFTEGGYVLKNDSDSIALYDIDLCDTTFKEGVACKGVEFVLSGKEKTLDLKEFRNGNAAISIRDPYSRYHIKESIKL